MDAFEFSVSDRKGGHREDGVVIQVPMTYLSPAVSKTDFGRAGYEPMAGYRKNSCLDFSRRNSSTSFSQNQAKIKYKDFLPEFCRSSKDIRNDNWMRTRDFKKLLESANKWLSENPGVELKSCESIIWSSDDVRDLASPSDVMVTSVCLEEDMPTFYILGFRLWYVVSAYVRVCTISLLEFIPLATDSTVQDLVRQIDSDIRSEEILNLETVSLPLLSGYLDSNLTSWRGTMDYTSTHAYFLRLYLLKDKVVSDKISPVISHLSIEDFVPRLNDDGQYEGFSELLQRCNQWSSMNDITIVNIQSIFAKEDPVQHEDTGKLCFFEKPGLNHPDSVDYFRILRVVYMSGISWQVVDNLENNNLFRKKKSEAPPICYEMFTPELLNAPLAGESGMMAKRLSLTRGPTVEGMSTTFAKMADFISEGDLDIVNAEMVSNPVQFRCQESKNNLKFLFSIRLFYRPRNYRRESKMFAGPKKTQISSGQIKPGPIFLKNVVSRKFPYRWLVLSLTAFASMTIIVVISIIYNFKLNST